VTAKRSRESSKTRSLKRKLLRRLNSLPRKRPQNKLPRQLRSLKTPLKLRLLLRSKRSPKRRLLST